MSRTFFLVLTFVLAVFAVFVAGFTLILRTEDDDTDLRVSHQKSIPVACVSGCDKPCEHDDILQFATLERLQRVLGDSIGDTSIELETATPKEAHRQREQVECLRPWAERLKDKCTREQYIDWLDYYEHQLDRADREIETHELRDRDKERGGRYPKAKVDAMVRKLPKPPVCPIPPRTGTVASD